MPRGGKRKTKLNKTNFRRIERKAFEEFNDKKEGEAEVGRAKTASFDEGGGTALGHSASDPSLCRPRKHTFGLGDRPRIWAGADNVNTGPGTYDVHEVGSIKWSKDEGISHPAQGCLTNFKSPKLISFGKPKSWSGPGMPPLSQSPGPGHYNKPDLWDP